MKQKKYFLNQINALKKGAPLVNSLINQLPFELHISGYNYYVPGTTLQSRLARNDFGINPLDEAGKAHDIAYATSSLLENKQKAEKADKILEKVATFSIRGCWYW